MLQADELLTVLSERGTVEPSDVLAKRQSALMQSRRRDADVKARAEAARSDHLTAICLLVEVVKRGRG